MKLSLTLILLSLSLIYSTPLHLTTKQSAQIRGQELWCVAKNNAEDAALQSALDWACSSGGADCTAIQQGGPCYDPADIQRTASFAFNDYFLKHGLTEDSCNFDNAAALTSLNPSHANCKFPSSDSSNLWIVLLKVLSTGCVDSVIILTSDKAKAKNASCINPRYSIEELLPVAYLQERRCPWSETSRGMPGLKTSSCVLVGRLQSILHFAPKSLGSLVLQSGRGSLSGDKDASNIWGEPRLYLRPRTRETAGSGGLSLAREMPYP
ncbi:hypothetical protein AgCh_038125 [Apium graveolens]